MEDINMMIAIFANGLQHKTLNEDIIGVLSEAVLKNMSESLCISICNVLFAYYSNQYMIASTDSERNMVVESFAEMYSSILDDKYISVECIKNIFIMHMMRNDMNTLLNMIKAIADDKSLHGMHNTYIYVCKHLINCIIDRCKFCEEPYATILDKLLSDIREDGLINGKCPNYFD